MHADTLDDPGQRELDPDSIRIQTSSFKFKFTMDGRKNGNLNRRKNRDGDSGDDGTDGRRGNLQPRRSSGPPALLPPSDLLGRYNDLLDRHPLRTKMCTSFCVSAFGSALGSYLSAGSARREKSTLKRIDWVDVLSYAIHGGIVNAPISHYWFEWLSRHGPSSNTKSVLVDQLAVQPPLLVRE